MPKCRDCRHFREYEDERKESEGFCIEMDEDVGPEYELECFQEYRNID